MDKFLMICTVCADFFGPGGDVFRITPLKRGVITEAPVWVKETYLFKLLEQDGSVQFVNRANEKKLENDPMEGILADGKAADKAEEPVQVVVEEPIIKTRKRTAKKKDDAE